MPLKELKYDLKVASLNSEITRLKSMIPDDDSCKSCNSIYSELTTCVLFMMITLDMWYILPKL
jgi:hypothetical protein